MRRLSADYRVLYGGTGQWSGVYDSYAGALDYARMSVAYAVRHRDSVVPHHIQRYEGDDVWHTVKTLDGSEGTYV
jgi:hypothetical protein